ncbi:aminopeptidase N [Streptomyces roseolilacinus]|uniref:Aminopeptidase N n=1 Tax=Streptomyces roseolilacinus TaxID=66904 RepID=A0A918AZH6_9ACTN|nr:aminopeptidase N [Streptomyces roseolilacinus]GGP96974.1 aminopeptidase N [Streptomyces roseolilacinus]
MGVRSLTRAEAEERAELLEVERYDVSVDFTDLPDGPDVRCVSTITFSCTEPGGETFVDCAATVLSATLNDVPLPPAAEGRIALRGLAAHNTLRVETVQSDTTHGPGVHRAVDPSDGEVYVWTSFEPDEARFVWACFDQPDLKAPHAFTVTAPAGWTVTSNAGTARTETLGGARRWTFPDTPPLSPYNTVVNAGPFHEIRRNAGGYDLGLYTRRSLAGALERDADEILTLTAQGLAFFARVFAMPFPQHRYDQVFVPEFGGAMENYGCVTWSDDFLRRSAPTPAERELLAKVLLHEMAHMWFGNIVTMRWWDDLWLNEAFAEFACHWAATSATAHTDAWAGHLAGGKLKAYLADQGPATHPIRQPVHDVDEAAAIFDDITYPKGASVLQQLMTYLGEEAFSAGMSDYFARHAWGTTTLQDLVDALGRASGRDLDAWKTGWLDTAGTDRLTLDHGPGGAVLHATGPSGAPPRPQVLAVGAYRRTATGLERTARTTVEVRGPRTPVDLPAGADLYLVNDDDLTFATVRPDAASRDALLRYAADLPTALSRGVAVATVWDMLVNGEATAAEAARGIGAVLEAETCDAAVEPYLTLAGDIAELWAPEGRRVALEAEFAATCRRLADRARHPAGRRVALRSLARAASGGALERLRAEAVEDDDYDLRWRALARAAELGEDTAAEAARLLAADPDPDAHLQELRVRAGVPDARVKAAVWQALAIERAVPVSWVGRVAAAFWRPGQDEVLRPFTRRYLDLVPGLGRGGMIPAMVYTGRLLPRFAIDGGFLDEALAVAGTAAPVVRKTLTEHADVTRRMLRSRGTVEPDAV